MAPAASAAGSGSPALEEQPTVISVGNPAAAAPVGGGAARGIVPGTRLAQFELMECVGGGGMGRVYRATDTALARTVAVKILSHEQAGDLETVLRFRNEAQTAARLNHEGIVRVYHAGEEGGLPYIVFEFIEGQNLRNLVERRGPLPLAEALSYTLQVAEALAHAAERNVVHRDIKPSNVLLAADGRVKLIDMGLARVQQPSDAANDLTASGVTLGTFDYISPEQARDPRTADARSDIYSLGCTLFFMLSSRPPFPEGTVLQKLLRHQADEPPDVREFRPELPEEVSRLVRRMMAKDPRRRFQTTAQLAKAVVHLAEQLGLHPAGPGQTLWHLVPVAGPSLMRRHLPWVAPLAGLIAMIVLLHFLWSLPLHRLGAAGQAAVGAGEAEEIAAEPQTLVMLPPAEEDAPEAESVAVAADAAGERALGRAPDASADSGARGAPATPPSAAGAPGESTPAGPAKDRADGEPSGVKVAPAAASAVAAPPVPPAGAGILVVGDGAGEGLCPSLAAACAKAQSGDVVELRYNGPRQESPIALCNLKLTIRAGTGYRPVIAFRPAEADPVRCPRAMFALAGSQLTVVDVTVELDVPREIPAEQWSLVELHPGETARWEKCVLTIRNASVQQAAFHPDVAFFRLKSPGPAAAGGASGPAPHATVALADCVVRGEATVLRTHDYRPARLTWNNGLLATTERLLAVEPAERMVQPNEDVQIELQHLTAVARGGLCRMAFSGEGTSPPIVRLSCANSILAGSAGAAWVEQIGVPAGDAYRERLAWNGDRTFYEGIAVFWRVLRSDPEAVAESMDFEAWRSYWGSQRENLPALNVVSWKDLPAADRPVDSHVPADYTLAPTIPGGSPNPALGAASDKGNAGFLPERLPAISAPASAANAAAPSASDLPLRPTRRPDPGRLGITPADVRG